jgi:Mrp family chromosome partitioning ATPase
MNFELMQRAGRLLEIEVPGCAEAAIQPADLSLAPAFQPAFAPVSGPALAPPRARSWRASRSPKRLTANQIAREESQRLVHQIFVAGSPEPPRVVVFAGIDHGNGCSRICARTAESIHENLRGSVCLVEGNLRSPSLPELYGVTNHRGLTDALLGEGPIRNFAKPVRRENFYLLSCGSLAANSYSLLNSNRLTSRFRDLRNEFDYVVVDAPPLTRYSDAIALGKVADGLALVLEANSTRREAAARASENLRAAEIRILAAVLNKRTFPIPEPLYRRL